MQPHFVLYLLLGSQVLLIGLDIWERFGSPHRRYRRGKLRPRTLWFLVITLVIYGALQFAGLAAVPDVAALVRAASESVAGVFAANPDMSSPGPFILTLAGLGGFYLLGLSDYLVHRFVSHSRLLWFTHENHHLIKDVSAFMPGIVFRPFAVVVYLPSAVASIFFLHGLLGIAGFPHYDMLPLVLVVAMIQTTILGISHSAYMRHRAWVHRLCKPFGITSPQEHWLHHSSDLEGNYGNSTTLWDRVFGTYLDPERIDARRHRAGLAYDQDFLGALTAGRCKISPRWRDYFELDHLCHIESAARDAGPDADRSPDAGYTVS